MNQIPAVADPKGYRTILNCLTNGQFDEPKWRLLGVAGILMASAIINVLFFDKSQLKSNLRLYNYLLGGAFVVSIVVGFAGLFLKNEFCDKLKSLITAIIICLSLYSAIMGVTVAINIWKASTGPVRVRPNEPNELQTLQGSDSDEQVRRLNIHEYQGAELMGKFGINVPKGVAVSSLSEIQEAIKTSFPDQNEAVVKSQILVGGRRLGTFKSGLQGGVHIVKKEEVEDLASKMLGQLLITKQTGPQDKVVSKIHLCEKLPLVNEMYFAITLDRKTAGPLIIACSKLKMFSSCYQSSCGNDRQSESYYKMLEQTETQTEAHDIATAKHFYFYV